jgi:hypothetical protein
MLSVKISNQVPSQLKMKSENSETSVKLKDNDMLVKRAQYKYKKNIKKFARFIFVADEKKI